MVNDIRERAKKWFFSRATIWLLINNECGSHQKHVLIIALFAKKIISSRIFVLLVFLAACVLFSVQLIFIWLQPICGQEGEGETTFAKEEITK